MLFNAPAPCCGVVAGFGLFRPPRPPRPFVVWWWVLGYLPPPLVWSGLVWSGSGLWVSGLVLNPFPPPCGVVKWWVLSLGFRVCARTRPVVWVVGLFRVRV